MITEDNDSLSEFNMSEQSEHSLPESFHYDVEFSKDDYIKLLIELSIEAYQMASQSSKPMNIVEIIKFKNQERITKLRYIATFVEFEKTYIQQALSEIEASDVAEQIFNNYDGVDDPIGFEQYMNNYFTDNFNYLTPERMIVVPSLFSANTTQADEGTVLDDSSLLPTRNPQRISFFEHLSDPHSVKKDLTQEFDLAASNR